jgi:hypothetical protein
MSWDGGSSRKHHELRDNAIAGTASKPLKNDHISCSKPRRFSNEIANYLR